MDSFALYQSIIIGIIVGIGLLMLYGFLFETTTTNYYQPAFNITAYNVSIMIT